jgi:hypothetical protein
MEADGAVLSLAVAMIGQALAQACGLMTKHAIKQVDRLLGNLGIDVWETAAHMPPGRGSKRSPAAERPVSFQGRKRRLGPGEA